MSDTYTVKMRRVVHITVDCLRNDPVDIRCGGPQYLGFDFYVAKRYDPEIYIQHIRELCEKYEIPISRIDTREKSIEAEKKLWTKPRITEAIAKEKYLHGKGDYRRLERDTHVMNLSGQTIDLGDGYKVPKNARRFKLEEDSVLMSKLEAAVRSGALGVVR